MLINAALLKLHKTHLWMVVLSVFFYWLFAYHLVRTDYMKLIGLYTGLFVLFYGIIKHFRFNSKILTYLAFGFRVIFLLAIPNLSQDFYRFIWDGRMLLEGFNPYLYTVASFIESGEFPIPQAQELYNGMGNLNAGHYSNYPPINQLCFAIAAIFYGKSILGSVVVMRILIIAADFGTLHFGKRLLQHYKMPVQNIFWYILNPFIIIELTGNLHFEGVMIFFLVWSLYLLKNSKWAWAGIILALSISVKLIPLIFLPLYFQWFVKRQKPLSGLLKLAAFNGIVIGTSLLLFIPFYSPEFVNNYSETVALWFQNFEFNASIYYLARGIGYLFRGYNEIAIIGKIIVALVILVTLIISLFRKNKTTRELITSMLFALSFYYFTATTMHPWYLATPLILSIFTRYRFPLIWSFVIILSYLAYLNINIADKSENLWIIATEYIIVYSVFIWEVFIKKTPKKEPL